MTIDWKWLTTGWNDINNTDISEKEMLEKVYTNTGSIKRSADILGVSTSAFRNQLRKQNVTIKPKGWGNKSHSILYGVEMEGRTSVEIARETGTSLSNIHSYANSHGIKLKSLRGKCRGKRYWSKGK